MPVRTSLAAWLAWLVSSSLMVELRNDLGQKLVSAFGWQQNFEDYARQRSIGAEHPNVLVGIHIAKCGLNENVILRELFVNVVPIGLQLLGRFLDCLKQLEGSHSDEVT